jgi:hypothetical protein
MKSADNPTDVARLVSGGVLHPVSFDGPSSRIIEE